MIRTPTEKDKKAGESAAGDTDGLNEKKEGQDAVGNKARDEIIMITTQDKSPEGVRTRAKAGRAGKNTKISETKGKKKSGSKMARIQKQSDKSCSRNLEEFWGNLSQADGKENDAENKPSDKTLNPDSEEFFPGTQTGGLKRTPIKTGQEISQTLYQKEETAQEEIHEKTATGTPVTPKKVPETLAQSQEDSPTLALLMAIQTQTP